MGHTHGGMGYGHVEHRPGGMGTWSMDTSGMDMVWIMDTLGMDTWGIHTEVWAHVYTHGGMGYGHVEHRPGGMGMWSMDTSGMGHGH